MSHPMWPFPVLIAEGSATVFINGKPAARLHSKMVCGAHIKSGSPNTFIGGPTVSVAFVLDIEGWMHSGLELMGLLAAGAALVMAAMVGLAVLVEFVVIGGLVLGGMTLLGELGDRLGPGYRDLLQGVAGMAMLGLSPKMARLATPKYKLGVTEADILAMPKGSRPNADTYLSPKYVSEHLAQFDKGASRFMTKSTSTSTELLSVMAPPSLCPSTRRINCWPTPRVTRERWSRRLDYRKTRWITALWFASISPPRKT